MYLPHSAREVDAAALSATERRRGATYEREIARELRARGFNADRTSNGKVQAARGDISGVPGLSLECKRCERIELPKWLAQATEDAQDGNAPAVVFRRNGEKSWAVVPFAYLLDVLTRLADAEAAEDERMGER